ncbi:hypothetical protein [Synechococcus sp. MIT S1220]|uniref:hypothetical protein n=1 Tax=Synechococcus sp. MIT S1220 TaxID=3082549 RepID=UPI0039AEF40F
MMLFTAIEIASFGAAEGRKHEDGIQESNPGEFFVPLRQLVVLLGALKGGD